MGLKHAVLAAEVSLTESTVSNDPLYRILAILEVASDLLWSSAANWEGHVERAFAGDVVA